MGPDSTPLITVTFQNVITLTTPITANFDNRNCNYNDTKVNGNTKKNK